jgi:alpha-glucosidase
MFYSPSSVSNTFLFLLLRCVQRSCAQSPDVDTTTPGSGGQSVIGATTGAVPPSVTSSPVATVSGTVSTFRPIFTVPAAADEGATLIPNIKDPQAIDAQNVCPGYTASGVVRSDYGLSATLSLAGPACNVYGTDIETLNLTVEYQSADRLAIKIVPAIIDASNISQYILPDRLVHQPTRDADADMTSLTSDLMFVWSNKPTFSFGIFRKSTGDTLFSTEGTKLVFENQFIEFASPLPENYNLYGLGETIHGLRLGNNFTKTIYAADVGDPIDQ